MDIVVAVKHRSRLALATFVAACSLITASCDRSPAAPLSEGPPATLEQMVLATNPARIGQGHNALLRAMYTDLNEQFGHRDISNDSAAIRNRAMDLLAVGGAITAAAEAPFRAAISPQTSPELRTITQIIRDQKTAIVQTYGEVEASYYLRLINSIGATRGNRTKLADSLEAIRTFVRTNDMAPLARQRALIGLATFDSSAAYWSATIDDWMKLFTPAAAPNRSTMADMYGALESDLLFPALGEEDVGEFCEMFPGLCSCGETETQTAAAGQRAAGDDHACGCENEENQQSAEAGECIPVPGLVAIGVAIVALADMGAAYFSSSGIAMDCFYILECPNGENCQVPLMQDCVETKLWSVATNGSFVAVTAVLVGLLLLLVASA